MASRLVKILGSVITLGLVGGAGFLWLTAPQRMPASHWQNLPQADLANGERMFWAGGCASCHAATGASGEDLKVLSGGQALPSPFGTFYVPNISSDEGSGIGAWTLAEFGDAMQRGTGKRGEHLYPSFPYASYARMEAKDINDLYVYLKSLPASTNQAQAHDLPFPFNQRIVLGGWKMLFFDKGEPKVELASASDLIKRGQYLVEGPGHCAECHTPRNALGGFETGKYLAGGANPEGEGTVPNITPASKSMGSWSEGDIVSYLETGFTPDYDSVGGSMVKVQENMARLPAEDRAAIAAYLKAIPGT
jgi:mono/diheme cytochrome c family protein